MYEWLYFHEVTIQDLVKKCNQQLVRKNWNKYFKLKKIL